MHLSLKKVYKNFRISFLERVRVAMSKKQNGKNQNGEISKIIA